MKLFLTALAVAASMVVHSQATFTLGEIRTIKSNILNEERTLNIYLPEGYDAHDTAKYPVIYLLDGSADEDFIHIVGLVQFNSFPWVGRLPKCIVAGIANTDRKHDFTFPTSVAKDKELVKTGGGSAAFIAFIEQELQPFIARTYHTTSAKTIIGESLGGLLAAEILFRKPQLFDRYIIVSPSLWWDNGSLLKASSPILTERYTQRTDVYVAVGKEGLTPSEPPRVMEVDANLLMDKLRTSKSRSLHTFLDYLPEEDHATIMHQAVLNAFKWLHVQK